MDFTSTYWEGTYILRTRTSLRNKNSTNEPIQTIASQQGTQYLHYHIHAIHEMSSLTRISYKITHDGWSCKSHVYEPDPPYQPNTYIEAMPIKSFPPNHTTQLSSAECSTNFLCSTLQQSSVAHISPRGVQAVSLSRGYYSASRTYTYRPAAKSAYHTGAFPNRLINKKRRSEERGRPLIIRERAGAITLGPRERERERAARVKRLFGQERTIPISGWPSASPRRPLDQFITVVSRVEELWYKLKVWFACGNGAWGVLWMYRCANRRGKSLGGSRRNFVFGAW